MFATIVLAVSSIVLVGLPVSAALASLVLIGYLFGKRTRSITSAGVDERHQQELARAARTADQLHAIIEGLRYESVAQLGKVAAFKRRLRQIEREGTEQAWASLCTEAEAMLGPTMQLAQHLSHNYDQIRQQVDALETFTRGRIDPLTGVGNSRALDQQLQVLLTSAASGNSEFAIALLSLDRNTASPEGRSLSHVLPILPKLASTIRSCMRDSDFVARYGDDEFVVVMPQTTISGAKVFIDRLRLRVSSELGGSICCGLTPAQASDEARSLLARADSALYSAKAAGPNRAFVHTGKHIREHAEDATGIEQESRHEKPVPLHAAPGADQLAVV